MLPFSVSLRAGVPIHDQLVLAVSAGAWHQEEAALFQIDEVRRAGGLVLRSRRSNAARLLLLLPQPGPARGRDGGGAQPGAGVHSAVAAASHVSVDSPSGFAAVQELVMPEQPGRWQVEPSQSPAQTVALSTEWLADAELVIVRTTESGPVSRTLQMEGVRIAVGGSPGGNRP